MERYGHYIIDSGKSGFYTSDMMDEDNGEWVKYEDAMSALATRDAEIEKLRAMVVWCVERGASHGGGIDEVDKKQIDWWDSQWGEMFVIDCDGTDAGILAAVREAMAISERNPNKPACDPG